MCENGRLSGGCKYRLAMISASSGWLVPFCELEMVCEARRTEKRSATGEDFDSVTSEHRESVEAKGFFSCPNFSRLPFM